MNGMKIALWIVPSSDRILVADEPEDFDFMEEPKILKDNSKVYFLDYSFHRPSIIKLVRISEENSWKDWVPRNSLLPKLIGGLQVF